jgi:hypothetical protein
MDGELELLGEQIAEQAAHLDAAMHRLLADLREFDARGGWHVQGAMSCAHWLAWRVGWDLVTARERVRVARKLEPGGRMGRRREREPGQSRLEGGGLLLRVVASLGVACFLASSIDSR